MALRVLRSSQTPGIVPSSLLTPITNIRLSSAIMQNHNNNNNSNYNYNYNYNYNSSISIRNTYQQHHHHHHHHHQYQHTAYSPYSKRYSTSASLMTKPHLNLHLKSTKSSCQRIHSAYIQASSSLYHYSTSHGNHQYNNNIKTNNTHHSINNSNTSENVVSTNDQHGNNKNNTPQSILPTNNDPHKINSNPPSALITKVKAYAALARIDKPIGTLLLLYPCCWALTLAATHALMYPPLAVTAAVASSGISCSGGGSAVVVASLAWHVVLFSVGAFVMRGAGCTINDLWDRRLDRMVERTKSRPLASGAVTPLQALVFLAAQLSIGLAILLQLNWNSIALGAASLVLVTIYPLMKRYTYFPQAILGLTFNWGALLGFMAILNYVPFYAVPLYLAGWAWTMVYDTIYAIQDIKDDQKAAIKSTAIFHSHTPHSVLNLPNALTFYSTLSLSCFITTGLLANASVFYYAGVGAAGLVFLKHVRGVHPGLEREDAWNRFVGLGYVGLSVWIGCLLDFLWSLLYILS